MPSILKRQSLDVARESALDKACWVVSLSNHFIAGIDEKTLLQAVECAVDMNNNGDHGMPVPNYVDENVSTKVVKIILKLLD